MAGRHPDFHEKRPHRFRACSAEVVGRQVISGLRLGAEISEELDIQYIMKVNEDSAFKESIEDFELNDYVLSMRLTDATEEEESAEDQLNSGERK